MDEQNDALTVAMWCWPDREWSAQGGIEGGVHSHGEIYFFPRQRDDIADAEQVVLARGLAEQYAKALLDGEGFELYYYVTDETGWLAEVAKVLTAPLASRLRALARVARENPMTPRETPCPFVHGDAHCGCSCGKECGKFSGHCREHGNFVRFGGSPVARAR